MASKKVDRKPRRGPSAKPTSAQVAERAQVSRATVSRAFTPGAAVDTATRDRIVKAALEIGYRVEEASAAVVAGSAIGSTSHGTVGLVMGDLDNPFYNSVLTLFLDRLHHRGLRAICRTGGHTGIERGRSAHDAAPRRRRTGDCLIGAEVCVHRRMPRIGCSGGPVQQARAWGPRSPLSRQTTSLAVAWLPISSRGRDTGALRSSTGSRALPRIRIAAVASATDLPNLGSVLPSRNRASILTPEAARRLSG